jgi:signal transduction histidine kinase
MDAGTRVLLLEFVNGDQFPGRISWLLPFVRGYLDRHEIPSRWVRFGISTTNLLENARDEITLGEDELAVLGRAVDELAPTLIVVSDEVHAPQLAALRARAGGAAVLAQERFEGLPGLPAFDGVGHLRDPAFSPGYAWEPGNAAAERREMDNVHLGLVERCGHRRPVVALARYAGVDDPRVARHRGCTFCGNWQGRGDGSEHGGTTPQGWIARQIDAIARSRGPGRLPNGLLLGVVPGPRAFEECLSALRRNGMVGRVQLLFGIRADQVPWVVRLLRPALADEAAGRLTAGIYATGVESFDADELALYNKAITPLDGLAAIGAYRQLAEEFPGRFWYTGVSFLLFTPWTTLEALRLNFGLLRLLEVTLKEAGNVFQSRLRLHRELPITALAEREGLVEEEEPDGVLRMNRRKLFAQERPWRFLDARLRPLSRIVLRYDLLGSRLADELARRVEAALGAARPGWRRGDDLGLLEFTIDQLDALVASPAEVPDEETLLARAVERARARRAAAAASPARRLGEARVELPTLLARLAPLVRSGLEPALAIAGVSRADLRDLAPALEGLLAAHAGAGDGGRGTLVVAARREVLDARVACEARLRSADPRARAAAEAERARLHGEPACCARARTARAWGALGACGWAVLEAAEEGGEEAFPLDPLVVPAVGAVPCRPGCPAAAARRDARRAALGISVDPRAGWVFSLAPGPDGELVALPGATEEGGVLRYDPDRIAPGDGEARALLRRGDRVRTVPGQLRVHRGGTLAGLLTASHGLLHPGLAAGSDADAWRELARAAARAEAHRLRRGPPSSRPEPREAGAPVREPGGELRVLLSDPDAGGTEYRFQIARHREGRAFFRRSGDLVLRYEHRAMTPRATACARALLQIMSALGRDALAPGRAEAWSRALPAALARCEVGSCAGRVEWRDGPDGG